MVSSRTSTFPHCQVVGRATLDLFWILWAWALTELLGRKIFHYEICMVYSAQNMSPLFQSELLSMICLLWKMHVLLCLRTSVQPNLSSIREKSKHRFSARNNSSSLRCVCFPKTCVIVNKGEILLLLHKNPPISSGLAWRYTKENNSLQWIPFCVESPLQHQSWKYTG